MRTSSRAGLVGKILLWVVGIPLLVVLFAIAAVTRGLFGSHRSPDQAEDGHAQPPAIYQPKGPEAQPIPERHSGGILR
jgi:hypothetical protein